MYLQPQQVRHVLHSFAAQAPAGSRLVIDILAGCAVGMAQWHASVGPTKAQFHWGIRSLRELTDCHPRLRLLATHSVAAAAEVMSLPMSADLTEVDQDRVVGALKAALAVSEQTQSAVRPEVSKASEVSVPPAGTGLRYLSPNGDLRQS